MHDFQPQKSRRFIPVQGSKSIYNCHKVNTMENADNIIFVQFIVFRTRNRKKENLINFRFIMDINFTTQIHFTQFHPSLSSIGTIFHLTKHSIDYLSNPV